MQLKLRGLKYCHIKNKFRANFFVVSLNRDGVNKMTKQLKTKYREKGKVRKESDSEDSKQYCSCWIVSAGNCNKGVW